VCDRPDQPDVKLGNQLGLSTLLESRKGSLITEHDFGENVWELCTIGDCNSVIITYVNIWLPTQEYWVGFWNVHDTFHENCVMKSMYLTKCSTSYEFSAGFIIFRADVKGEVVWFHKSFESNRSRAYEVIALLLYFYYSMIVLTFSTCSYHVTRKVTSYFICY
jgi:hypothetical protein